MKQLTVAILMMLTSAPGAQQPQADIPFDSVPNLLKLPTDVYLGEAAGVAVNSKGHLFVFSRGAHTQLFEFDRDGRFLREIGKGLYGFDFAHVARRDAGFREIRFIAVTQDEVSKLVKERLVR